MSAIETRLISQSPTKPLVCKRYIDDVFSLWDINKEEIGSFIELANNHHPTIKFTADISEITFLDTCIYKGDRFKKESILDVKTHFKQTETFQYTHFSSCHPSGVKKGFITSKTLRLLRTNSSKTTFAENISLFKQRLRARGYPNNLIDKTLSISQISLKNVGFENKKENKQKNITVCNRIPPFCAKFENHFNEQMVSYRKATIFERNIQGTSHNLL